eukprot:6490706-Amphidinium_carterae.3
MSLWAPDRPWPGVVYLVCKKLPQLAPRHGCWRPLLAFAFSNEAGTAAQPTKVNSNSTTTWQCAWLLHKPRRGMRYQLHTIVSDCTVQEQRSCFTAWGLNSDFGSFLTFKRRSVMRDVNWFFWNMRCIATIMCRTHVCQVPDWDAGSSSHVVAELTAEVPLAFLLS